MKNKLQNRKSVNLISLGCAKNLVDSEILLGGINQTNLDIVKNPEDADTIIVNTCGFLEFARASCNGMLIRAISKRNKRRDTWNR